MVVTAAGMGLTALGGCATSKPPPPPPVPEPVVVVDANSGLSVGAVPAFRLAASPSLADSPSRLVVLNIKVGTSVEGVLTVSPEDFTLQLPNGQQGRVFDRARAVEVLHRTTLADANLAYLTQGGNHPYGGLSEEARAELSARVSGQLFASTMLMSPQLLEGFIVVDTGLPFASLNGGSIQIVAYRLRDATPVTSVYPFAPPSPATAAAPTAAAPTAAAPTAAAPTAAAPMAVAPTAEATTAVAPTAEATTAVAPTAEATTAVAPTAEATTALAPTAEATTAVAPTAEAQ